MKYSITLLATCIVYALGLSRAQAQLYWDINGTNAGASDSGDASGTWNSTNLHWNTAADGMSAAPGAWVND